MFDFLKFLALHWDLADFGIDSLTPIHSAFTVDGRHSQARQCTGTLPSTCALTRPLGCAVVGSLDGAWYPAAVSGHSDHMITMSKK